MNWMVLAASLIVTLVVQTTIGRLLNFSAISLDLLLVLVMIYALVAPAYDARLAGWIIGFAVDVTTEGALGVHAFAFGLTALFITQLREGVNRQLLWGRLLVTCLGALPGQFLVYLHLRFIQPGAENYTWGGMLGGALLFALTAAVVATLITPLVAPTVPRRRSTVRPARRVRRS
jgi:rod shape-determining protein MreD